MKKLYIVGITLVILSIIIASGCITNTTSPVPIESKTKITVAQFGDIFFYAPLYVAYEKGYFEEQGLDVTIVSAGGLDKTYAALLSGDAQFGVADPMITAISGEKGRPGIVISSLVRGVPMWAVTKKNITEMKNPTQLKGYSVGTTPSPSTAFTLQTKMFKDGNLTPNIRELASGTCLAAMDRGDVDICIEFEPGTSTAIENGAHIVYYLGDYYPTFALTGVFVLPGYLDTHKNETQKVVNALQKALNYMENNREGTIDVLQERFPNVKRDTVEKALDRLLESNVWGDNLIVDREGWDAAAKVRLGLGHIKEYPTYEKYVDVSYAQKVIAS